MSEETKNTVPASPEVEPAAVRKELDQENVTHKGTPVAAEPGEEDSQRHMGAVESDVTPIRAPMEGPSNVVGDQATGNEEDQDDINPSTEITPG